MNKKIMTAGIALCVLATTGMSFAALRNLPKSEDFAAVKTALETKNYASLPETAQSRISEEQFAAMVAKNALKSAVDAALEKGDYAAFRAAKIAEIPSEADFQKMSQAHKARSTHQTAVETAIKNNDFAAFQKAHESLRATMETLRPEWARDEDRPTEDTTRLRKQFDRLVAQYKEDGTFPEGDMGGLGHRGDHGKGGPGMGKKSGKSL